jgi:hypothetical protein
MVEVTLAMAVVGLGVTGIMAMFPVAIQSSRDAVGDNYSSELSSQFFAFIEANARKDWTTVSSTSKMPDEPKQIGSNDADSSDPGDTWSGETGNVYTIAGANGKLNKNNGIYGVKSISPNGSVDFLAHVRIWSGVLKEFYTGGPAAGSSNVDLPGDYGKRVYIEISWPASRPWSLREKRYYVRELFNQ